MAEALDLKIDWEKYEQEEKRRKDELNYLRSIVSKINSHETPTLDPSYSGCIISIFIGM